MSKNYRLINRELQFVNRMMSFNVVVIDGEEEWP